MPTDTTNHRTTGLTSVKLGNRKQALSELASHQKRSVHSLLIEAVDQYIERTQARMLFEQDAINSYERFQATGMHTTIEEMEAWAKSLATSNPQSLPLCHK